MQTLPRVTTLLFRCAIYVGNDVSIFRLQRYVPIMEKRFQLTASSSSVCAPSTVMATLLTSANVSTLKVSYPCHP